MKAVILNGGAEPADDADLAASRLEAHLTASGADIRHFILRSHDIGHCLGDFDCWIRTPGRCRIKDEGQEVERAVHHADLVAMTTPIAFGAYGPYLKKVTDRLIPLILPFFAKSADLTHHAHRYDRLPRMVAVGFSNGTDATEAELFRAFVESQALNLGAPAWSAIVLPANGLLSEQLLTGLLAPSDEPANPSGSAAGATARLIKEITAVPVSAAFAPAPRIAILVGSARPAGKSTSLSIARYLARQCQNACAASEIVMAATFARKGEAAAYAARTLAAADVLVIAAPLYVDALPYLVLLALQEAAAARAPGAPVQRIVGVINCGFPEPEHTRFAFASLRAFANATGGHYAGGLPVGGGEVIHGQDLDAVGGLATPLRAALDVAARSLAAGGVIPPDVSASLAKPVMPPALYRLAGSMGWRLQGWANGLWPSALKARPFDEVSEADWQKEVLRSGIKARPLRVIAKHAETEDAVTLLFEDPAHDPITYEAGQYITLEIVIDGAPVRRAYSLASIPDEPGLAITVKRVPGGLMSNHLHDVIAVGDIIRSHGPSGDFTAGASTAPRKLLLIGGGSGIVPLLAVARSVLRSQPQTEVALIYGASSRARALYADAIAALARDLGDRFALRWVLESADPSLDTHFGRLDEAGAGALVTQLDPQGFNKIMICGPGLMRDSVRAMLTARGVDPSRIAEESFASPRAGAASLDPQKAVLVTEQGERHSLHVQPGQTLLDAALDAGEPISFSCMSGGCGACVVTVVEGLDHVALDEPNTVAAKARSAGVVPACITRLTGPICFKVGPA